MLPCHGRGRCQGALLAVGCRGVVRGWVGRPHPPPIWRLQQHLVHTWLSLHLHRHALHSVCHAGTHVIGKQLHGCVRHNHGHWHSPSLQTSPRYVHCLFIGTQVIGQQCMVVCGTMQMGNSCWHSSCTRTLAGTVQCCIAMECGTSQSRLLVCAACMLLCVDDCTKA